MKSTEYEAVIGLEVHCQLSTASKAFSPDSAGFGAEPNEHVDPVSLGYPGTLPVFNSRAIEFTVRLGLALHCAIQERSIFARKHYFYPDLPKGYQISQYEEPICVKGFIDLPGEPGDFPAENGHTDGPVRRIRIRRIHMEEDAGKSIHGRDSTRTLLDFNRCGVPLIEIVTEPDLKSPRDAYLFMRKMRQMVRYLEICDGNMEEGSLRCDANVSLRRCGETMLGEKSEIKNLNSFRHVERALEFEIERQQSILESGQNVVQETRLWDDAAGRTKSMRSKEEAHDYRYFPDPDLPPVLVTSRELNEIRTTMPALPDQRVGRYMAEWSLPGYDAAVLAEDRAVAEFFESCVSSVCERLPDVSVASVAKGVSNFMMTRVLRSLKELDGGIRDFAVDPESLGQLVALRIDDRLSSSGMQQVFEIQLTSPDRSPEEIAKSLNLMQISDLSVLNPVVEEVVTAHPNQAAQFRAGKRGVIGFFIGQVMRSFSGSPDPRLVRNLLEKRLQQEK